MAADDLVADSLWGVAPFQRPTPEEVTDTQRRRLMLGMTRAIARKGFAEASVADALIEVRVSRKTFYELFKDKEDCFIAAYKVAHAALVAHIHKAAHPIRSPLRQSVAEHRAYLEFFTKDPEIGKAFVVGIRSAGERAMEKHERALDVFAGLHRELHARLRARNPQLPALPDSIFAALVGAHNSIVAAELEKNRGKILPAQLPVLLYLTFSTYGLPEAAQLALAGKFDQLEKLHD